MLQNTILIFRDSEMSLNSYSTDAKKLPIEQQSTPKEVASIIAKKVLDQIKIQLKQNQAN